MIRSTIWLLFSCTALFGALIPLGAQGQIRSDDFVVTVQGDTLYGKISRQKLDRVTLRDDRGTSVWEAPQVRMYRVAKSGKTYLSLRSMAHAEPMFLLQLIDGPLQLFLNDSKRGVTNTGMGPGTGNMGTGGTVMVTGTYMPEKLFARKTGSQYVDVIQDREPFAGTPKKAGKNALIRLIQDNAALATKLAAEQQFNRSIVEDYVHAYNLHKKYALER